MYQHTTLLQNLNDSNLAQRRHQASVHHNAFKRPEHPRRMTRPLARLRAH